MPVPITHEPWRYLRPWNRQPTKICSSFQGHCAFWMLWGCPGTSSFCIIYNWQPPEYGVDFGVRFRTWEHNHISNVLPTPSVNWFQQWEFAIKFTSKTGHSRQSRCRVWHNSLRSCRFTGIAFTHPAHALPFMWINRLMHVNVEAKLRGIQILGSPCVHILQLRHN